MKDIWAYAHESGEAMYGGEFGFMTANTEDEAKADAQAYAREHFEEGGGETVMVVFEMVPRYKSVATIIVGDDLDDGDKEPDEFDGLLWITNFAQDLRVT